MNDKYKEYCPAKFHYDYPYTWEKRNRKYLEKRDDRPVKIKYIDDTFFENEESE